MRKKDHRHPVLEAVVFAAALLLAGFVGRELWRRRQAAQPGPEMSTVTGPVTPSAARPATPLPPRKGTTEESVTSVPPLKLSRIQPRRKKPVVPAPK